jgi:DnaJ-class molecular chaperone
VPVTLGEAAAGTKIDVPTPRGTVTLHVPPGTSGGTKLRVKGQGIAPRNGPTGDLLAEIQIVLPKDLGDADRQMIEEFGRRHAQDPRAKLRW